MNNTYCFIVVCILCITSACSDFKSEHALMTEKFTEASRYGQQNDVKSAVQLMEGLIVKYPENPEPYLNLIMFKHIGYGAPKNINKLSEKEKKQRDELIKLGTRGLLYFENVLTLDEKEYLMESGFFSLIFSLTSVYYDYGMYEKTIELYDKYYFVDKYISHSVHKFNIFQYASALAKHGYVEEGKELYLKSLIANR